MKIFYESKPYLHFFVENFYSDSEFKEITNELNSLYKPIIDDRIVLDLKFVSKKFDLIINPFVTLANLVAESIQPDLLEKFNSDKYIPAAQMQFNPKGWDYGNIHTDIPSKIFTFTVYMSEFGKGTQIFEGPTWDDHVKTAKWVQNGGMGFIRTENSWHNFGADKKNDRVTITFFYREADEYKKTKSIYVNTENPLI